MEQLLWFPGPAEAEAASVGGKAAALVGMAAAGLPVPEGVVLTVAFFAPWLEAVRRSEAWSRLPHTDDWGPSCEAAKAIARELPLQEGQRRALAEVLDRLDAWGGLAAVRSSSPEEDLRSASFAGGYETVLGVTPDRLEEAVRACFASALDLRVLRYKEAHGFDPFAPSIAVVVQRQLASEVAGVGFSIDPTTNDYDEAAFDACWGLGETVVAGLAEPDHVVVHKPDGAVRERRTGAKQRSIWLLPEGGTEVRSGHRSEEPCLDDARIAALTDLLVRVEAWLDAPVDIEWAVAGGRLYVLQARPITTWLPLPDALVTAPGERRWLYMDASLSNGLTLNVPVSPLGLDWLYEIFTRLLERFMGPLPRTDQVDEAVYLAVGGRLYANLSYLLWMQTPSMLARGNRQVDALMAATMGAIDARRYRARNLPPFATPRVLLRLPRLLWAAAPLVVRMVGTLLAPGRGKRRYQADVDAFEAWMRSRPEALGPFEDELREGFEEIMDQAFDAIWSTLGAYGIGLALSQLLAGGVDERLAMQIQQGFEGNVVVEMGIALSELARQLPAEDFEDLEALADRLAAGRLPAAFLEGWEAFHDRFGHRGPVEMDLAQPRYRDDPMLALEQLATLRRAEVDLAGVHAEQVGRRAAAFAELQARSGALRRWLLRWPNRLLELFGGTRDTPKYLLTLYNDRLRRAALAEGRALVAADRLDAPEQVFDLHLYELVATRTTDADLRALCTANRAFLDRLRALRRPFPPVIDSRGRIIRPPAGGGAPGELHGMGVSPGVATGRVRRLRTAEGARVEPGEVLVAYTTDPGWTPLFVHVAAVVLEIGGTLQHGAVVAREYGKPCVVGIADVLDRLEDGQLVEVDGLTGVVRILDED